MNRNSQRVSLHEKIRAEMLSELQTLSINDWLPSDRVLAKRFGVSVLTVNRAMAMLEHDGYISRLQGKGTIFTSRERRLHRDDDGKGDVVLVATPNYYCFEFWFRSHAADELARKNGYRTMDFWFGGDSDFNGLIALAKSEKKLRGLLVQPNPGSLTGEILAKLDGLGIPVVLFDPYPSTNSTPNIYSISPDYFQMGYLGIKRLLDAGCQSLAFINSEPPGFGDQPQLRGVKQALYEGGLRLKDLVRPTPCCHDGDDAREVGYHMTREALKHEIDGIFCATLFGAVGAYRAIGEKGLSIPADISVVAGTDTADQAAQSAPPMTAINMPFRWEMEVAFDILLGRGGVYSRHIISTCELVDRKSVSNKKA